MKIWRWLLFGRRTGRTLPSNYQHTDTEHSRGRYVQHQIITHDHNHRRTLFDNCKSSHNGWRRPSWNSQIGKGSFYRAVPWLVWPCSRVVLISTVSYVVSYLSHNPLSLSTSTTSPLQSNIITTCLSLGQQRGGYVRGTRGHC